MVSEERTKHPKLIELCSEFLERKFLPAGNSGIPTGFAGYSFTSRFSQPEKQLPAERANLDQDYAGAR